MFRPDPTKTPGSESATLDALNDGILITSPLPCRPNKKISIYIYISENNDRLPSGAKLLTNKETHVQTEKKAKRRSGEKR